MAKVQLNRFSTDVVCNILSFAGIAFIGILLNAIILKNTSAAILGAFNQNYALYILLSQLAVGGFHLSVQKYIPEFAHDKKLSNLILIKAIILSFISTLIVFIFGYIGRKLPGVILQSEAVSIGFVYCLPGLFFFSINKVLLSFHNGYRRMKAFALFQFLRFFLLLSYLYLFFYLKTSPEKLPLILTAAEATLCLLIFIYSIPFLKNGFARASGWYKTHLNFGMRALTGNFLLDVNTRVDIFILGVFCTDKIVGIYSFSSLISEGFMQLPIVLRNVLNPVITKAYITKPRYVLERIIRKSVRKNYKFLIVIGLFSVICFPIVLFVFSQQQYFTEMWVIYSIMLIGIIGASGLIPFQMIFSQTGFPTLQSKFIFILFAANLLFNLILVPYFGMYGAAIATSMAYLFINLVQIAWMKKYLSLHIL